MSRKTAVLAVAAVAAVAAAVIVTIDRRHHESPERVAVTRYIRQANAIQISMRLPLARAVRSYRHFASGGSTPVTAGELAASEATLVRLQRRLGAIPAPPAAHRLRARLLALVGLEVRLAGETRTLSTFSPSFARLLRRSRAASVALTTELGSVKGPNAHRIRGTKKQVAAAQKAFAAASSAAAARQADALDAYDATLDALVRRLHKLAAPPVMAPAYRAELRTLAGSRAAAAELAAELRRPVRTHVTELGRAFAVAVRGASSVSAQRGQIAAIKAYNERVRTIAALQERVRSELARLQRT